MAHAAPIGLLLRDWRRRRRLSQLALAAEAEVSQRHLSCVESGRAAPSREMVLRLAETLSVPLRERNALLVAAGFAPLYRTGAAGMADDAPAAAARQAVSAILRGHEPFPALAVDRHWTLVDQNRALAPLLASVDEALLRPPVNVLRVSLHPRGLAPRIANVREWRAHVLARLARQVEASADPVLMALQGELTSYPVPPGARPYRPGAPQALGGVAIPLRLSTERGVLSLLSATTVFGTALDVELSELAIESFFPADEATADLLLAPRPAALAEETGAHGRER